MSTPASTFDEGLFQSLGEQLQCIVNAESTGQRPDQRLHELHRRAAAAGASEAVPSDGGFLVAPQFSRAILKRMYSVGDIYKRCLEIPIQTSELKFPQIDEQSRVNGSRLGGAQAFLVPEGADITTLKGRSTFQLTSMKAEKVIGLLYVPNELVTDSNALDAWVQYALAMEGAFTLENLFVNGTGAGQPLGVVNSNACITVAKESGQAANSIISLNVINMVSRLWAPSRKGAIWLYNQNALSQLSQLQIQVGVAGSQSNLWHWCEDETGIDTLAGIPAFPSEYCQALGSVGDLILVDFGRYVVAVRERGLMDVSMHIRFLHDESLFRFTIRANGQPVDSRPVTPLNGTATTSPIVALAART